MYPTTYDFQTAQSSYRHERRDHGDSRRTATRVRSGQPQSRRVTRRSRDHM